MTQIPLPAGAMRAGSSTTTKTCARDVRMYYSVMLWKGNMQTTENEDAMWPEKIAAIYEQFPWLEEVYRKQWVDRVYVKRFDERSLDLVTESQERDESSLFGIPHYVDVPLTSLWLVTFRGIPMRLGMRTVKKRSFIFFEYEATEYYSESVRHAVSNLGQGNDLVFLVLVQHGIPHYERESHDEVLTRMTIFKPPQGMSSLSEWYKRKTNDIEEHVKSLVAI